jgi:succinate dehydrogenase / fumarate reductase membrane anchor subunit
MANQMQSHLGRARGLGSARAGSASWWAMKLSSILLLILSPFFMYALVKLSTLPFDAARVWIANPINGLLFLSYFVITIWHSYLGLNVVIEDYIHSRKTKMFSALLLKSVHGGLILISTYSIIIIAAKF